MVVVLVLGVVVLLLRFGLLPRFGLLLRLGLLRLGQPKDNLLRGVPRGTWEERVPVAAAGVETVLLLLEVVGLVRVDRLDLILVLMVQNLGHGHNLLWGLL